MSYLCGQPSQSSDLTNPDYFDASDVPMSESPLADLQDSQLNSGFPATSWIPTATLYAPSVEPNRDLLEVQNRLPSQLQFNFHVSSPANGYSSPDSGMTDEASGHNTPNSSVSSGSACQNRGLSPYQQPYHQCMISRHGNPTEHISPANLPHGYLGSLDFPHSIDEYPSNCDTPMPAPPAPMYRFGQSARFSQQAMPPQRTSHPTSQKRTLLAFSPKYDVAPPSKKQRTQQVRFFSPAIRPISRDPFQPNECRPYTPTSIQPYHPTASPLSQMTPTEPNFNAFPLSIRLKHGPAPHIREAQAAVVQQMNLEPQLWSPAESPMFQTDQTVEFTDRSPLIYGDETSEMEMDEEPLKCTEEKEQLDVDSGKWLGWMGEIQKSQGIQQESTRDQDMKEDDDSEEEEGRGESNENKDVQADDGEEEAESSQEDAEGDDDETGEEDKEEDEEEETGEEEEQSESGEDDEEEEESSDEYEDPYDSDYTC